MKFTPEVIAALATLRANADNDFERHRLDVLERDLTSPPQAEIIDDTYQRFNGVIFHQNNSGHFTANFPIHRAVYLYYHGDIPDNRDIHHIDHNKANNVAENLQCLTPSEHKHIHNMTTKPREFVCEICGKKFFSTRLDSQNVRYCSKRCNARAFKQSHMETRICAYCGKEFSALAINNTQFCSQTCADNSLWDSKWKSRRLQPKICPVCEQKFIPKHTGKQIYCSHHCRNIALLGRNMGVWQKKQEQRRRTCPACGKNFIASRKEQRYCSITCANVFRISKRQTLEEKVCPTCGKTFMPRKGTQVYCSNACAIAKRTARKRLERKEQACVICGKNFTPKYPCSKNVCCSRACGVKLAAQKNKKRVEERQKVCPVCGKMFIPKKGQAFCSRACAGRNYSSTKHQSDAEKQRICPVCGKSFIPSHSKVVCCSRECGAKITAQKNKKPSVEKNCPVCGKTFTVRMPSIKRIYCSRVCSAKGVAQKNKKRAEEKPKNTIACPVCGKSFIPAYSGQIYCSLSCVGQSRRKSPLPEIT